MIDLDVKACFETDGSCFVEVPLMKGSEVPQLGCDMSALMNMKGKARIFLLDEFALLKTYILRQ